MFDIYKAAIDLKRLGFGNGITDVLRLCASYGEGSFVERLTRAVNVQKGRGDDDRRSAACTRQPMDPEEDLMPEQWRAWPIRTSDPLPPPERLGN